MSETEQIVDHPPVPHVQPQDTPEADKIDSKDACADAYQTDNELSENEDNDNMASNTHDSHPGTMQFDDSISEVYEAVENYTFGINDGPDDENKNENGDAGSTPDLPKGENLNGSGGGKVNGNSNGANGMNGAANGNGNHDDEEEDYHSNTETESTCSMEECVARIESTLRRNFKKIQNRDNNNHSSCNKKEVIRDVTKLPGYQPVPDNCPQWKKAMIEKKNSQLLDDAKKEVQQKKAEEEKWRDVPAWKKNLILEKEKKCKDVEAPTEQERARQEEEMKRLEAMPDWKRKLILSKRGEN